MPITSDDAKVAASSCDEMKRLAETFAQVLTDTQNLPDECHGAAHSFVNLSNQVSAMMRCHVLPPVGIGCRRSGLVYKFHALLHSMFLESGSWVAIKESCLRNCVSITADMGTEMGLGSLPRD
eukprot:12455915-Alexandrium_andersonii.AAC.1